MLPWFMSLGCPSIAVSSRVVGSMKATRMSPDRRATSLRNRPSLSHPNAPHQGCFPSWTQETRESSTGAEHGRAGTRDGSELSRLSASDGVSAALPSRRRAREMDGRHLLRVVALLADHGQRPRRRHGRVAAQRRQRQPRGRRDLLAGLSELARDARHWTGRGLGCLLRSGHPNLLQSLGRRRPMVSALRRGRRRLPSH